MKLLLALLLSLLTTQAATLTGGILYSTDTTGTNARPSNVTITPATGGTNLLAGTITITNLLRVTAGGAHINGFITNDSLAGDGLMFATSGKILANIDSGVDGQVLQSQGAGSAPVWADAPTGDTIWTNDNGTISATSTVADGGIAFSMNSSNFLASGNLFEVKNNGTNSLTQAFDSTLILGQGARPGYSSAGFYRHSDTSKGDNSFNDIFWQNFQDESDPTSYYVNFDVGLSSDPGFPGSYQSLYFRSNTVERVFTFNNQISTSGGLGMAMTEAGVNYVVMSPQGIDPVSTSSGVTPYQFGTDFTMSSGNLLELGNNTILTHQFTALGQIVLAGTTNQVTFGATNTAPVSSLSPTKWISVQVSGESVAYRIPLYQ